MTSGTAHIKGGGQAAAFQVIKLLLPAPWGQQGGQQETAPRGAGSSVLGPKVDAACPPGQTEGGQAGTTTGGFPRFIRICPRDSN